jgi:hypothetical protein
VVGGIEKNMRKRKAKDERHTKIRFAQVNTLILITMQIKSKIKSFLCFTVLETPTP